MRCRFFGGIFALEEVIWDTWLVQMTWQKIVDTSEKELFEALEHSDKVLDEELERAQEEGRTNDEGKEARLRPGEKGTTH